MIIKYIHLRVKWGKLRPGPKLLIRVIYQMSDPLLLQAWTQQRCFNGRQYAVNQYTSRRLLLWGTASLTSARSDNLNPNLVKSYRKLPRIWAACRWGFKLDGMHSKLWVGSSPHLLSAPSWVIALHRWKNIYTPELISSDVWVQAYVFRPCSLLITWLGTY